jgi:hypothetical protein
MVRWLLLPGLRSALHLASLGRHQLASQKLTETLNADAGGEGAVALLGGSACKLSDVESDLAFDELLRNAQLLGDWEEVGQQLIQQLGLDPEQVGRALRDLTSTALHPKS